MRRYPTLAIDGLRALQEFFDQSAQFRVEARQQW
jgi:hypothetical protein